MDMRKIIFFIIIVVLLTGSCCLAFHLHNEKRVRDRMLEIAAIVNNSAPIEAADFVLIDSAAVLGNRVFLFSCTMWNVEKDDISAGTIERYLLPDIIKDVKRDSASYYLRKSKITLCYSFSDKNGEHIHDFFISPSDLSD